ncbi:MAG: hypothetical protein SGBAC_003808 [Bacillariaceae sp.]
MSASKKRPAREDGFVQDDDNMEAVQARKRAVISSPHSKNQLQNDQFLDDQKSLWQQGMEQLNEQTKKTLKELDQHEDIIFVFMDYIRQRDWIHQRYNPSCGQVVAMGSDDVYQLGIAASSDTDKEFKAKDEKMHLVEPITKGIKRKVDTGKFRDVPIGSSESPKEKNEFPTLADLSGPVRDIEAGEALNASIMENGQVYTWGMG